MLRATPFVKIAFRREGAEDPDHSLSPIPGDRASTVTREDGEAWTLHTIIGS
jgi:hypothetical protein